MNITAVKNELTELEAQTFELEVVVEPDDTTMFGGCSTSSCTSCCSCSSTSTSQA
jgi:hypothetical protein